MQNNLPEAAMSLEEFVQSACEFDPRENMLPFVVGGALVGWMRPAFVVSLEAWPEYFTLRPRGVGMNGAFETAEHRSAVMAEVTETLGSAGLIKGWRNEMVTASETFYSPPLFFIERAASRLFGITAYASHLNGLTVRNGQPYMWIARRSAQKSIDAGKLDNMVAGRIPRSFTPQSTLIKECQEEAGIAAALAATAKAAGAIKSRREVPEGLHAEIIFTFDIVLPENFTPQNQDGEVAEFFCLPLAEVLEKIEKSNEFTADAALVIIDCLIRRGYLNAARDDYLKIIHALRP